MSATDSGFKKVETVDIDDEEGSVISASAETKPATSPLVVPTVDEAVEAVRAFFTVSRNEPRVDPEQERKAAIRMEVYQRKRKEEQQRKLEEENKKKALRDAAKLNKIRREEDLESNFDGSVTGKPNGLTDNLVDLTETCSEALSRVLLPEEKIIAEFDCYYPGEIMSISKFFFLVVVTCGRHLLVLLYKVFLDCMYQMQYCNPALVDYHRGKVRKGRNRSCDLFTYT
jgi:hypothetical protein